MLIFSRKQLNTSEYKFEKFQIKITSLHIATAHLFHPTQQILNKNCGKYWWSATVRKECISNYLEGKIVSNSFNHVFNCCWKYFSKCVRIQDGELKKNLL